MPDGPGYMQALGQRLAVMNAARAVYAWLRACTGRYMDQKYKIIRLYSHIKPYTDHTHSRELTEETRRDLGQLAGHHTRQDRQDAAHCSEFDVK